MIKNNPSFFNLTSPSQMSKNRRSAILVAVPRELGYLQILELNQRLTTIHKTQLVTLKKGIEQAENILKSRPGSQNGSRVGTSFSGRPSTSISCRPGTSFSCRPSTSASGRPGTSFSGRPETSFSSRLGTSFSSRPGTSFSGRPGTSFSDRPGTSFSGRQGTSFSSRPGTSFSGRTGTSFSGRPSTSFSSRPGTSHCNRPETSSSLSWRAARSLNSKHQLDRGHSSSGTQIIVMSASRPVSRPGGRRTGLTEGLLTNSRRSRIPGVFREIQLQQQDNARPLSEQPRSTKPLDEIFEAGKQANGQEKPLWYPESDTDSSVSLQVPQISPPVVPKTALPPGFGLQRESTSFGVYSNLSAHSRNIPTDSGDDDRDSCYVATSPIQTKLLQCIKKSETSQVRRILNDNPHMKLNFLDEDGSTVLHCGIRSGNREILQLLRNRRPPVNIADKVGNTALHIAATLGQLEVVHSLVASGAKINLQNTTHGRTALHEAILAGHKDVVDLLLFHQADVNVVDKNDNTAFDLCHDGLPREYLVNTVKIVEQKRLDIGEISSDLPTTLTTLDVIIDTTGKTNQMFNTLVVCKRYEIEELEIDQESFQFAADEDLAGDIFTLRIGNLMLPIKARISLPLYTTGISPGEELSIRPNKGLAITPEKVCKEENRWMCTFSADLRTSNVFLPVSKPRNEKTDVGKQAVVVQSAEDARAKVHVEKGTFSKPTTLSLQIMSLPDDAVLEEDQILSSTQFYSITSDQALTKPLNVQLPSSANYGGEGKVLAIAYYPTIDDWKVIHNLQHGETDETVAFPIDKLPAHTVVVKVKKRYDEPTIIREIMGTYKQVKSPVKTICFLCLSKRIASTRRYTVLVECCDTSVLDAKRRVWTARGFVEQKQRQHLDQLQMISKQTFRLIFFENVILKQNQLSHSLQFHPKRNNVLQFEVEIPKGTNCINGRVYVSDEEKAPSIAKTSTAMEDDDWLTLIDVLLDLNVTQSNTSFTSSVSSSRSSSLTGSRKDSLLVASRPPMDTRAPTTLFMKEKNDFLNDILIDSLIYEMEDEWYKIYVLMGIDFTDVQKMGDGSRKTKLFLRWRDEHEERDDNGVPVLLAALFKGGRRDIANTVQIELKKWYENRPDKNCRFYKWVSKAYQNSNLLVPTDYPKPMSDAYLVLMSDELSPSRELANVLAIDERSVVGDGRLSDGIKVMKMLTLFRETTPSRIDALNSLISCLETLQFLKTRSYAIMCAKAWVKRTATRKDDPFRYQVDDLMRNI